MVREASGLETKTDILICPPHTLSSPSLAAVLYFVIPRVPAFELALDNPFTSDDKEPTFTRIPAMFGWHAQLNVAVDGQSNWIPVSRWTMMREESATQLASDMCRHSK